MKRPSLLVLLTFIGMVAAVALTVVFVMSSGKGEHTESGAPQLANDVFQIRDAQGKANDIRNDGPLLFQDLLRKGTGTNIYVQHLGDNPRRNWYAFSARPDGAEADCLVQWKAERKNFVDSCSSKTFPANGEGLQQFRVDVTNNVVAIDFKRSPR